MTDTLVLAAKQLSLSADTLAATSIINAIKGNEPWWSELIKELASNAIPVILGAITSYIGVYLASRQNKDTKKIDLYFELLKGSLAQITDFKRDVLHLSLELDVRCPPGSSWEDIKSQLMGSFESNLEKLKMLRSKWIGRIDDSIIDKITNLINEIEEVEYQRAILESSRPTNSTGLTSDEIEKIDETLSSKFAESINEQMIDIKIAANDAIAAIKKEMKS